jgi:hypothetical protein
MKAYCFTTFDTDRHIDNIVRDMIENIDKTNINNIYYVHRTVMQTQVWIVTKYKRDFLYLTLKYGSSEDAPLPNRDNFFRQKVRLELL